MTPLKPGEGSEEPEKGERPLRMRAYYYGFIETGVRTVDLVLEAVAIAGKESHHTDAWNDADDYYPVSPATRIQVAANEAAAKVADLEQRCNRLEKELEEANEQCNRNEDTITELHDRAADKAATIRELTKQLAEMKAERNQLHAEKQNLFNALSMTLPMAKGYAHIHDVGGNWIKCDAAQIILDEQRAALSGPPDSNQEGETK